MAYEAQYQNVAPSEFDSLFNQYLEGNTDVEPPPSTGTNEEDLLEFFNSIPGTVEVDNSVWGSIKKSYHEASTLVGNVGTMVEAYTGGFGGVRLLDSEYNWSPGFFTSEEMYGDDWKELTYDQRRQRIVDIKKDRIKYYYGNVEDNRFGDIVGTVAGTVADPTSLLPIGQTYKAAAGIGAALGATDAVIYDLAQKGEIEPSDVVLAAGLGAVLAPLLAFGSNKITSWLRDRTASKVPITGTELIEQMDHLEIPVSERPDPFKMADELNSHYELSGEKLWQSSQDYTDQIARGEVLDVPLDQYIFDTRMEMTRPNAIVTEAHEKSLEALEKKWRMSDLYIGKEDVKHTAEKMRVRMKAGVSGEDPVPVGPSRAYEEKYFERDGQKGVMIEATPEEFAAMMKNSKEDGELADNFVDMANPETGGFAIPEITDSMGSESLGAPTGYGFPGIEGRLFGDIAGSNMSHTSPVGSKVHLEVGKLVDPSLPITEARAIDLAKKAISGEWSAKPETAFQSWGAEGKIFGELFKRTNEDLNMSIARKTMDLQRDMYKAGVLHKNFIFTKEMPGYTQIPGILNKTIDPKMADPMAIEASKSFKKFFNDALDDSVAAKILSPKQASALRAKAEKDGYWPRVYNEFYLNSKDGQKKWIDTLTGRNWTEEEIEKIIDMISLPSGVKEKGIKKVAETGKKRKQVKAALGALEKVTGSEGLKRAIKEGKIVKKGKVYKMPEQVAKSLWEKRREIATSSRSAHLERERKILLPDDAVMPFLVQDPMTVIQEYAKDVYKRIHMAQRFGKNDEIAEKLFEGVGEKIGPRYQEQMQEVFYTMAGDADASKTIKQFTDMDPRVRDIVSRALAFETLKLSMASIANSAQAIVNGTVALERLTTSPLRTLNTHIRAVKHTINKEGRDFALRSGAAAESTMLQVMGELTAHNHSIFHGVAKGVFKPLNYLNQPSKFLKSVGYTSVESVQRMYGANLGRAMIEEIRDQNINLLRLKKTRGLSKSQERKLAKNKNTLAEFGINPEVDPAQIGVSDLARAAQRFSNEINFAGSPDQLPIKFQSPYVKPFFQFKSFVVKQSAFLNKYALGPIRKNHKSLDSYRPLAAYLGIGTTVGMGLDEFRRWVLADDKDLNKTERVLRGHAAVGGLGIMYDVAVNASYSETGVVNWLAGPAVTDVSKALHGAVKSITEWSLDPIARAALDVAPPVPLKKEMEKEIREKLK